MMQNMKLNRKTAFAFVWVFVVAPLFARAEQNPRDAKIEVQAPELPKKVTFKAKNLYEHAAYLAGDECEGRLAGSEGEAKAREYIIKRLKKSGYDEVRKLPFEFFADVKLAANNSLDATFFPDANIDATQPSWYRKPGPTEGAALYLTASYKLNDDFRPLRISTSSLRSKSDRHQAFHLTSGELVFAGYGISAPDKGYDDYAGLDVKGKVVLVIRTEPETKDGKRIGDKEAPEKGPNPHRGLSLFSDFYYKAATARDKGAVGIVIVNGVRDMSNSERAILEDFNRSGNKTDCGIPFLQVFPEVADDWLRPAKKTIGDLQKAIDEKLEPKSFEVKGVSISTVVDIQRERAKDENLVVVLPGNDPKLKDEIVVIGAHYDHLGRGNEFSLADKTEMGQIHRGADDNASGVSSVLELADALYKNRAGLKRTVWIMFFGAEELGTLGSNDFVKSPPPDFAVSRCAAMLNLDMVGRCRDKKVMVYGAATGIGFEDVLKKANQGFDLSIKTTADGFGGSDQTAFVNAGVPVMFFFTGSHSDYHKPSDSADKLNVNDQAEITALVFKTAAQVINAPERPKFVKLEAPKMSGGIGGVGLGTLPDYAFEGKGLRLSGVRAASAADKAGLKIGDIITKLADRKIENIYDYMNALRQCVAGVETMVTITRDGKEMEIKITPEKR